MTNKLGSSNPNRIPQPISEKLKQLNLNKGVNLEKDRRKKIGDVKIFLLNLKTEGKQIEERKYK